MSTTSIPVSGTPGAPSPARPPRRAPQARPTLERAATIPTASAPLRRLLGPSAAVHPLSAGRIYAAAATPAAAVSARRASSSSCAMPCLPLAAWSVLFLIVLLIGLILTGCVGVYLAQGEREAFPQCTRGCSQAEEACVATLGCECSCMRVDSAAFVRLAEDEPSCAALRTGVWTQIWARRASRGRATASNPDSDETDDAAMDPDEGAKATSGDSNPDAHDQPTSPGSRGASGEGLCYEAGAYADALRACATRASKSEAGTRAEANATEAAGDAQRSCGAMPPDSTKCVPHEAAPDELRAHVSVSSLSACVAPFDACERDCAGWEARLDGAWKLIIIAATLLTNVIVVSTLVPSRAFAALWRCCEGAPPLPSSADLPPALHTGMSLAMVATLARLPLAFVLLSYGAVKDGSANLIGVYALGGLGMFAVVGLWIALHGETAAVQHALAGFVGTATLLELFAILLAPFSDQGRLWLLFPWLMGDLPVRALAAQAPRLCARSTAVRAVSRDSRPTPVAACRVRCR